MRKVKEIIRNTGYYDSLLIISLLMVPVSFSKSTYDGGGIASSGNLIRIFFAGLTVTLALIKFLKRPVIYQMSKPTKCFALYWLFGFASLLSTPWLGYSVMKLFEYGTLILSGVYLSQVQHIKNKNIFSYAFEIGLAFTRVMIFIVLIGLLISPSKALLTPQTSFNPLNDALLPFQLQGWIIPLSNTAVCFYAGFNIYVSIIDYFEQINHKIYNLLNVLFYFGIAIVSLSRMAFLSSCLAVAVYIFFYSRNKRTKLLVVVLVLLVALSFSDTIFMFLLRGQTRDELLSVTGRTKWWKHAIDVFNNGSVVQKLFGFGFSAGEKIVARESSSLMYTLDSDFFANLISCGIIGLVLVFSVIITSITQIIKAYKCTNDVYFSRSDSVLLKKCSGIILIIILRLFTVTTFSTLTVYLTIYVFASNTIYSVIFLGGGEQ